MTLHDRRKKKLIEQLKNKEYRDAFVEEHINTGISFQIKTLRNQRKWTQTKLGKLAKDMDQVRISVLESPNYEGVALSTLKKLASAFDVALIVRFAPISELVEWELNLSSESLEAIGFKEDTYFQKETEQSDLTQIIPPNLHADVINLKDRISTKSDSQNTLRGDIGPKPPIQATVNRNCSYN